MSRKMMRAAVALLLLVAFSAGAAQAAPWSVADDLDWAPLAAFWERIVSWFRAPEPSEARTEGCHMDPDGRCSSGATTNEDPNG